MTSSADLLSIPKSLAQPEAAYSPIKSIEDVPDWVVKHHRLIVDTPQHKNTSCTSDILLNPRMPESMALAVRHIEIEETLNRHRIEIEVEPLSRNRELEENGILRRNIYRGEGLSLLSEGSSFFRWPDECRYEILYPLSRLNARLRGTTHIRLTLKDGRGGILSRRRMIVDIPEPDAWKSQARFPALAAWTEGNRIFARGLEDGAPIPRNISIYWEDAAGHHAVNRDEILKDSRAALTVDITGELKSASATIDDDKYWSATTIVLKESPETGGRADFIPQKNEPI